MASPLSALLKTASAAIRALALLSAAGVAAGLGIVLWAVAQRYVLGQPLSWADELNGYLVVGIVSGGLGAAQLADRHIGLDMLTGMAGRRSGAALRIWSHLCVLACAAVFTWSAWHTAMFNRDFGTYSNGHLEVPLWLVQLPMVAGGATLALAAAVRLTEDLREALQ